MKKASKVQLPTAAWYHKEHLPAFILLVLYALVDFVPRMDGADVMGAQWIYLSIVHVASAWYLLRNQQLQVWKQLPLLWSVWLPRILLGFLALAGISIFWAINQVEAMVVYARLLTMVMMFFHVALLLKGRLFLLKPLAQFFAVLLLIQCIQVVQQFYAGINAGNTVDAVIGEIKVNTGNKNILAATLAMKFSFTVFAFWETRGILKWCFGLIVMLCIVAIGIVNARASYVSIGAQLFLLVFFYSFASIRAKQWKESLFRVGTVIAPVVLGVLLSNFMIQSALALQDSVGGFNTIGERVSGIGFTASQSSGRTTLWASALDYIQDHPIRGAGYGNWKLASIPYERGHIDELFVAYHSHNDFLEMTAETGWLGGLLYLSLFVLSGIWLFHLLINAQTQEKFRMVLVVALALGSYFTDAMFNFPVERPVMQFFLAFVLALVCLLRLDERAQSAVTEQAAVWKQSKLVYPLFLCVALLFSGFFNAKVYQSMRAQLNINVDVLKGEPEMSFDDVNEQLPAIPNLNAFCFPINLIKARYLIKEKRHAEAIKWLEGCRDQSPLLSINEFFTAQSYLAMGNKDSAFYWTSKAFEYRPRVRNNYVLLNQLLVERKDSLKIENSFAEVSKYRKEPWVWNTYLGSLQGVGAADAHYRSMLDSALVLYPQDSTLMLRRNSIAAIATRGIIENASKAFMKSDYKNALTGFLQALEQNPYDYANAENVGMCYYAMQDYKNAIVYFDKVIAMGTARDAKSAYFKGVSLIALNQRSDACAALRFAARSNYPGAADLVKANCGQ